MPMRVIQIGCSIWHVIQGNVCRREQVQGLSCRLLLRRGSSLLEEEGRLLQTGCGMLKEALHLLIQLAVRLAFIGDC